ncbi:MAG: 1-acyl-sn-glycerol-3-phosphate acyltransferase [Paludibacteraceae bacterium]|nr:1-acyl-sn-glycerol-3-phosphate acyltransferase [Paludibacteraceae bacterium]
MLRIIYCIYQILVLPILVFNTLMCAIITMIFFPFHNSKPIHWVQILWCRLFFYWLFIPVTVDGLENIAPNQSYVFVANHSSMFDVFLIYGWLPVVFKWLMKKELRKVPFVGTACKAAGHIFVDRSNARSSARSLIEIKKQLHDGVCTVIFPEGTRSKDGQLGRFHSGAFRIAFDLGLPVIPLSLSGCYNVQRKGEYFVHRHPVHLHIGEPVDISQTEDKNEAMEIVRQAVEKGIKK